MAAMVHSARRGRPVLVVALGLVLSVLAACGGGGGDGGGGNPDGGLTGEPILVGLINQEDAPVGSFPELRRGAESAIRHVNTDLQGVGGRPLRLEPCATRGTAESSQSCATRLVGKAPVAVLGGVDLGATGSLPVLGKAGIPYIGGSPQLGEELTASGSYMLTGGTAADLLGQADYALEELHAKKIGALYVDLPGVLTTVIRASETVLRLKGATDVKLVAAKADEADFAPALKAVSKGDPDVIFVVFPAQSCARIMRTAESLGITAKMFYPSVCASRSVVQAAGSGADDAYFASGYLPFGDPSPDVTTWRDRTKAESVLSQAGFSVVMGLHALLTKQPPPDVTPAGVTAAVRATKDQPGYMAHAYTCDGKQVPLLKAVCNADVRILQYRSGQFADVLNTWTNGVGLVKLFG
jgi:branched-chain amino acid transport system substrate-binding protein